MRLPTDLRLCFMDCLARFWLDFFRSRDSMFLHLDKQAAIHLLELDISGGCQFFDEIAKCTGAVVPFGKRGIELEQSAFQKPELRRDLPVGQDFQGALDERYGLRKIRTVDAGGAAAGFLGASAMRGWRGRDQV